MQFKLKKGVGVHTHTDGKTYEAEEIIESDVNLENAFRGKFEKVYEPPEIKKKIPQPTIAKKKPIISTPAKGKGEDKVAPHTKSSPKPAVTEPKTEHKYSEYGKDISAEFPLAEVVQLVVCERAHWCTVIDPEDDEVMNPTKLRKKDVPKFLEQYKDPKPEDDDIEETEE